MVDKFMVTPYVDLSGSFPDVQEMFDRANTRYYDQVDWALDISEASFRDCDIRGIPARLIKRDPSTQVILTRKKAFNTNWRSLDLTNTHWPTAIEFFLEGTDDECVLVAPKRAQNFKALLEGLRKLRAADITEPN